MLGWTLTGQFRRIRTHWHSRQMVRALLRLGLFDASFYRTQRADLSAPGADLLLHYVTKGRAERLRPNPLFDPEHYAGIAGIAPEAAIGHYLAHGIAGRACATRAVRPRPLRRTGPTGRRQSAGALPRSRDARPQRRFRRWLVSAPVRLRQRQSAGALSRRLAMAGRSMGGGSGRCGPPRPKRLAMICRRVSSRSGSSRMTRRPGC